MIITETGSPPSTDVVEGAATDTYTVVLTTQPTFDVTITITPDAQTTVSTTSLTFATADWNSALTVTVTAVNDEIAEADPHFSTITHSASSSDSDYNGAAVPFAPDSNVIVSITDDDTAGVTIDDLGGVDVTEGASDTYEVVLTSEPTFNVGVTLGFDTNQVSVVPAPTLLFTPTNWATPQIVSVTAMDDLIDDGPRTSPITHSVSSGDTGRRFERT